MPHLKLFRLLLATSKMDFSLKLLKHSSATSESCFLSPFTVITALSVLYQGAGSDIQSEMATLDGGKEYTFILIYPKCKLL
ncbi:unnamed protein product [Onchocerca flexuosa]|uniref:SERPIN domain-containing protein n=1 Tax=Onchocerca flexuosa TaxID=387005 RepID=A0A183H5T7_9BILA|nr:unnamed protein product [Onchocerca flexuosa]